MCAQLNANHIPAPGITVSTILMFLGVLLNYFVPAKAFAWLTSIALIGTLWTWIMIMVSHLRYRDRVRKGMVRPVAFRMPGYPVANWLVIGVFSATGILLWFDSDTRVAVYVAPIWFGILAVAYRLCVHPASRSSSPA
jgi:AAT family amino acid transporter/D-serine/D-alanine/glycine transporter